MSTGGSKKAIVAAMVANGGIAVAKFVAFVVTGSASLLAESIHSVADTANQGLLILGGDRAQKIADDEHQFGYGRERFFWAFIVAMVLFALGGVYSIFEGIEKIRHPHELESIHWAIGVLLLAMVLEGYSFRTAIVEARKVKGNKTWWGFIRSSRSPELPVVLLEDAGALIGLILAFIGVSLAAVTGNEFWDGAGTLSIGVLLLVIAAVLSVEMKSLLIGEAAVQPDIEAIKTALTGHPGVVRVIDVRTQHIGPEELLVAGKIEFEAGLSTERLSITIDEVEASMRKAVDLEMQIYLEPDLYRSDHVDS